MAMAPQIPLRSVGMTAQWTRYRSGAARRVKSLIRRIRRITPRRAVFLAVVAASGTAMVAATAAGRHDIVTVLTGFVGVLVLMVLLLLRRRSSQEVRSIAAQTIRLVERVDAEHRRLLATVENERMAAADRHRALLAAIEAVRAESGQAQRRIIAAIETERLAAADWQREVRASLNAIESERATLR